jgi:hypothetical protein
LAGVSDTTATVREESEDQQQPEYKVSADTATVCTGKLEVLNVVLQPHLTIERPVTISVVKSRRVKWVKKRSKLCSRYWSGNMKGRDILEEYVL